MFDRSAVNVWACTSRTSTVAPGDGAQRRRLSSVMNRVTVACELLQGRVDRGDEYLHQVSDLIAPDFASERWSRGRFVGERRGAIMKGCVVMKPPPPMAIIIHVILKDSWYIDQRPSFG
jgi:hypothetical protein